jgi:hypothetical protein
MGVEAKQHVVQALQYQNYTHSYILVIGWLVWVTVFNATFNNISVIIISWRSVLLVEETEHLEKTTDLLQVTYYSEYTPP